jgi:DNA-binding Lrp family transcriptional regulator
MTFRSEKPLDDVDWRLLEALQADGRLSFKELGRRINLSAPAVAERVRRLEETGVITGYRAEVDARRAGQPLQAFVEMRCALSRCLLKTSKSEDYPEAARDPPPQRRPLHDAQGPGGVPGALRGPAGTPRHARRAAVLGRAVDAVRGAAGPTAVGRLPPGDDVGRLGFPLSGG